MNLAGMDGSRALAAGQRCKWKGAFFLLKMSQQSVDTGSVPYQTWCHITWLTAPKEKQNPKKANIQDPQTMDRPQGIFPRKIESNTTLLRLVCK